MLRALENAGVLNPQLVSSADTSALERAVHDGSSKLSGGGFVHHLHHFNPSPTHPHMGVFSYFRPNRGTCGRRRCCHVCPCFGYSVRMWWHVLSPSVGRSQIRQTGNVSVGVVWNQCGKDRWWNSHRPVPDFNTAAMLISFILFWKWLQSRAKGSTGDAIASLLSLQAPTALLVEEEDESIWSNVRLMQNCSWRVTL